MSEVASPTRTGNRGSMGALRTRDRLLPLPRRDSGYRSALFLGTTGAGKTTLVRQLLGTHPRTERFPPTSTAKTTVAETEIVLTASGPFKTVITFADESEVVQHLEENVLAAAVAALHSKDDIEVALRLLDHVDQRYRFSYLLGAPKTLLGGDDSADDDIDDDDDDDDGFDAEVPPTSDLATTAETVVACVRRVREVVDLYVEAARHQAVADGADTEQLDEFLEANLDVVLRERGTTDKIVQILLDEIRERFDAFDVGTVDWTEDGWPLHWTWECADRKDFLKVLARFTGNYAKAFGRLLTPLVNGIRVFGPFRPIWAPDTPKLVLVDGEGLGHVPGSVAALSSFVSRRLEQVDAVVLVDNAMQPMQAAPVAAMKAVTVSGNAAKLILVFTHFDHVRGDNLPTFSAREQHVLASVDNVLNAVREDLGGAGERQLRTRLESASFFLGGLQGRLSDEKKAGRHSLEQLGLLVEALQTIPEVVVPPRRGPQPVYERLSLTLAVVDATQAYHTRWRSMLGLQTSADFPKQHWARIKALTRRVAGGDEEYRELRPVSELRYELQSRIFRMLQEPVEWVGDEPDQYEQEELLLSATHHLTERLILLTTARVVAEHRTDWVDASEQAGPGSTLVRARIVEGDILEDAAPSAVLTATGAPNDLVAEVTRTVVEVGGETGFILR